MKIEDQVVSLKLMKVLRKLEVKQDSLYSYFQYDKWNVLLRETKEIFNPNNECGCNKNNLICSAYTFAEICDMLPATLICGDDHYEPCDGIYIQLGKEVNGTWNCNDGDYYAQSKRIADAPGKMILYLLSDDCHYDDKKFLEWKGKILGIKK